MSKKDDKLKEVQKLMLSTRKYNRRVLNEDPSAFSFLNDFLIQNIDPYVLQFEELDSKMTAEYARELKKDLSEKQIDSVKELPFNQFGDNNPKMLITFSDGSTKEVPKNLIEAGTESELKRDVQERESREKALQAATSEGVFDRLAAEMEGEASLVEEAPEQKFDKLLSTLGSDVEPKIEIIRDPDGVYIYELVNGEPSRIMDVDGKDDYEMDADAKKIIKEMYQRKKMFEDAPSIPESTRMDLPEVPPRDFADLSKFEGEAPKSMADFEKRFTSNKINFISTCSIWISTCTTI